MAALDDLISQIPDESLRERIRAEMKRANRQKKFGLVFEEHLPEATPLYDIPVKRGSVVATKDGQVTDIYYVEKIEDGQAACFHKATKERVVLPVDALVCVAQFGEPIYPYLQPLDTVCNAPDSDLWHTLIEADNYHALQLLEYLYAGKVDCIYIDPPYNTGARDWKYNNDYVDGNDTYRHSKWLSMMEKRLRIAKRLLNPAESVLIVTIDEKEYLHLGCLLEELFPEARIQMVSSVINRKGVAKAREFSRCDEYLFFVMMGEAGPALTDDNMLDSDGNSTPSGTTWLPMRRAGTNSLRKDRPRLCYPIYADVKTERIVKVGEFLPPEEKIENNYRITDGLVEIWPVKTNGDEGRWQLQGDTVMSRVSMGTVKAVPKSNGTWTIQYLNEGALKEIDEGTLVVTGRDANGVLIVERSSSKSVAAKSIWNKVTHDATANGTNLIAKIIGNSRFSFPKSLYAEHDAIRFFVASNPDALIIDFFAGSGTTLHAVNLLNAEDGGHRRCILVTNNEVSADEAKALTERGFQPGDEEWNKLGIARYVTWPRTVCSIEGHDVNGKPLKGDYITSGEEPMHMADGFKANAAFFKLGFLDKNAVALGRQFKELLQVLWLKAGAHGPCPALEEPAEAPDMLVLPVNRFAVLTDESQYEEFAARVNGEDSITTVYIVTDSEPGYREMVSGLHAEDTYQLYRDYLDNFRINHGGR